MRLIQFSIMSMAELISAVITLIPIKAQFAGPAGTEIVTQFLSGRNRIAPLEQLQQMALGLLGGNIALMQAAGRSHGT